MFSQTSNPIRSSKKFESFTNFHSDFHCSPAAERDWCQVNHYFLAYDNKAKLFVCLFSNYGRCLATTAGISDILVGRYAMFKQLKHVLSFSIAISVLSAMTTREARIEVNVVQVAIFEKSIVCSFCGSETPHPSHWHGHVRRKKYLWKFRWQSRIASILSKRFSQSFWAKMCFRYQSA